MAKQEIMEKTFQLAKEKLESLDNDKYLDFFKKTTENLDLKGDEVFIVPERYRDLLSKFKLNIAKDESVNSGFLVRDRKSVV